VTATAGNGSATVGWTDATTGLVSPITEHQVQVLVGGSVERTVTVPGGTATSTTVNGLTNGTTYTFRVIAVNDVGASAPSAESNPVTPDTPFPRVLSSNPADNAVGVSLADNLTATFSRAVSSPNWTAAVQLRNNATGALVGRVVTYDPATRTVTVNPNANLVPSRSYTMTLIGTGNNGIRDAAGVRLQTTTVDFTTRGDTTAPVVTTTTPADGATGVGPAANTVVNFSETVAGLNQSSVELRNTATGTLVPRALTVNAAGTRVTINPDANMARNTVYEVRLVGGPAAIRDAFDNPLATTTISFRTRP
jgi:methionine-rich copper-binding protein CopC